jgi:anti-sigma B factor antagonist
MLETTPRRLLVEFITGIHLVRFVDSRIVSEDEVREVVDQFSDLLEGEGAIKLLLNFDDVRTMSSNLIGELVKLRRSIEATGGALKLCCLPAEVRPIFSWCRVAFAIYTDERDALDSF